MRSNSAVQNKNFICWMSEIVRNALPIAFSVGGQIKCNAPEVGTCLAIWIRMHTTLSDHLSHPVERDLGKKLDSRKVLQCPSLLHFQHRRVHRYRTNLYCAVQFRQGWYWIMELRIIKQQRVSDPTPNRKAGVGDQVRGIGTSQLAVISATRYC